jgi:tripartite-type tricarboxylate transporter receptor subunit TctC
MGVPTVFKFVKDAKVRKVVELVISQTVFHRSYIAPPETPPAQLEVLRKAFDETMADPALLADAEKLRIDIEPLSGAKVQEVVSRLYTTPKDIVERARQAIRPD